jgi:hypothetical protein
MSGKVLGSVQPAYLAWMPLFERMKMSDVFVYLDDVEYSKNSFHNRNRIKTPDGPLVLTVPVLYSGNSKAFISQIRIDYTQNWQVKHLKSIQQNYQKAKYFEEVSGGLQAILMNKQETLADLNVTLLEFFRNYLGIQTPCYRSSRISVEGTANEKLINLCRYFGADYFIVKPGTEDYHPVEFFRSRGVEFKLFTARNEAYPQLYGDFLPYMSVLDYAMNCGPNSF